MDFGHQWNLVEPAIVFWSWWSVQHRFAIGSVEIVDGVEMFVDERLVDERPKEGTTGLPRPVNYRGSS
jgi:hypothetical protein